jgi:alkanesulfonate monooxygenase SsuD/methylene tetrahydromethanopterin reductase-like flavin-dependent oxidoreductase (luciferase family)
VLIQAGTSPQGQTFAAKHMDAVLCAVSTIEEMKAFRTDLRTRVAAAGRDPDCCKIFYVIMPTVGESQAEAEERVERRQAQRAAMPELALAMMGSLTDIDFSGFDLDAPVGELATNGQQGTFERFLKQGRTLREIACNYRYAYEDFVGTPETVAAQMVEVIEEVGGDGFVFTGNLTRRYVAEVTDGIAPALQKLGMVRTAYAHEHFRDNLLAF